MPIYEYFCKRCNTVFSFLSKTASPQQQPACPRCESRLDKWLSQSARIRGAADNLGLDEKRVESAFDGLLERVEHVDENDPARVCDLMESFTEECGYNYTEDLNKMEKADTTSLQSTDTQKIRSLIASKNEKEPEVDPQLYSL